VAQQLRAGVRVLNIPPSFREPSRYLVVGAFCALLNNAILIGGDAAGLHYAVCILLTFVLVLPASYLVHAWWTFRVPASWPAFGRFIGGSISSLVVASFAVWLFKGALELPMLIAAPVATVAMAIYNYLMARWAVTRGRGSRALAQS
jgi:putative flippase GtrA